MNTKQEIVDELRKMMNEGATPSILIRYLYSHYYQEKGFHFVVMDYFEKAFGVPTSSIRITADVRQLLSEEYGSKLLNTEVLHLIFQKKHIWAKNEDNQGVPTWLAMLTATDLVQMTTKEEKELVPELVNSWAQMDDRSRLLSMVRGYALVKERMEILSALSERLQRRLLSSEPERSFQ